MDKLCSILEEAQNIADPSDFDFGIKEDSLDFNMSAYIEPVSLNACKPVAHKAGKTAKKRTWKKPKDKPKRPLSAYNLFFQHEREKIISSIPDDKSTVSVDDNLSEEAKRRRHRKTHGKIGFAALARSIADKWKKIDDSSRSVFEARAEVEKQRYKKELDAWMKLKKERGESTKSKKKSKPAVTVAQKIAPPSGPKSLASLMKTGAELRKQVLQQMLAQQQQQQQNNFMQMGCNNSAMMANFAANQQLMQQAMAMQTFQMPNPMAGMNALPSNPLQCNIDSMAMPNTMPMNNYMQGFQTRQNDFGMDSQGDNAFSSIDLFNQMPMNQLNGPQPILSGQGPNNEPSSLEDELTSFMNDFECEL
eukprot:CAMPEP_0116555482 /NCGR_PEP_ID=MMETSP0397-20121206/8172_1 /TAXON_ID=216820 /ORGANISM="Cyclophora tenuis, Strain ECT3854" /LENGTH=361 /DNA_ID=CAMNT_0004080759 /DNA_START=46 /DNA_END=1131 /DNA_ORIENTATION=+